MASEGLWNYYRDEVDEVNDNASDGTSFKYKTKITEKQKQDLHTCPKTKIYVI